VITLNAPEAWYRKLREIIDRQQQGSLWMSQTKVKQFDPTYKLCCRMRVLFSPVLLQV